MPSGGVERQPPPECFPHPINHTHIMKQGKGSVTHSIQRELTAQAKRLRRSTEALWLNKKVRNGRIAGIAAASASVVGAAFLAYYLYKKDRKKVIREIPLSEPVKSVNIATSVDLHLHFGEEPNLRITAARYLLPFVRISLREGVLRIYSVGGANKPQKERIEAHLSIPYIEGLITGGNSCVYAVGINRTERFLLEQFSQTVTGLEVRSQESDIRIYGTGSAQLSVHSQNLSVRMVGSGEADCELEVTGQADITLEGSAKLYLSGSSGSIIAVAAGTTILKAKDLYSPVGRVELSNRAYAHLNVQKELSGSYQDNSLLTLQQRPSKLHIKGAQRRKEITYADEPAKSRRHKA